MSKKASETQNSRPQNTVRIPVSVIESSQVALNNLVDARLPTPEEAFIKHLLDFGQERLKEDPNASITPFIDFTFADLEEIMKAREIRGASKRALRDKCGRLADSGFFQIRSIGAGKPTGAVPPGRKARLFILSPIHDQTFESTDTRIIREYAEGRKHKRNRTNRNLANLLKNSSQQVTFFNHAQKALTENLVTGICDRAQRFTTQEVVKGNRITAALKVRGVDIFVQSTTSTHEKAQLAALSDQRVTRALITEITHKIDEEIDQYMNYGASADDSGQYDMLDEIEYTDFEESPLIDAPKQDPLPAPGEVDEDSVAESDFVSSYEEEMLRKEKEATARIKNDFFIDTTNLCRRCDYADPTSGTARRFVNQSLRRQYDTNYRIRLKADDPQKVLSVMSIFGMPDHTTDLRLITSLKSQFDPAFIDDAFEPNEQMPANLEGEWSQEDIERDIDPYNPDEIRRVRYWRISIDPLIFEQLLNRETRKLYTAHPQIMSESSGLAQTLYNVFSALIGRTNRTKLGQKERVFNRSVNQLHKHVWPTREYFSFKDELISIMRRYAEQWNEDLSFNTARMWGYVFTLYEVDDDTQKKGRGRNRKAQQELWLRVTRDPDDPLAGDDSYYNRFHVENLSEGEPSSDKVSRNRHKHAVEE